MSPNLIILKYILVPLLISIVLFILEKIYLDFPLRIIYNKIKYGIFGFEVRLDLNVKYFFKIPLEKINYEGELRKFFEENDEFTHPEGNYYEFSYSNGVTFSNCQIYPSIKEDDEKINIDSIEIKIKQRVNYKKLEEKLTDVLGTWKKIETKFIKQFNLNPCEYSLIYYLDKGKKIDLGNYKLLEGGRFELKNGDKIVLITSNKIIIHGTYNMEMVRLIKKLFLLTK